MSRDNGQARDSFGSWTPALTFATPGDLSVAYTTQQGSYTRVGSLITAQFVIVTSTFTFTTASGDLQVTGLPFTAASITDAAWYGAGVWRGLTKASFTDVAAQIVQGASTINFYISGSAQSAATVKSGDVPTGTLKFLGFTLAFKV